MTGGIRKSYHILWPLELDLIGQVILIKHRQIGEEQMVSKKEGIYFLPQRNVFLPQNVPQLFFVRYHLPSTHD